MIKDYIIPQKLSTIIGLAVIGVIFTMTINNDLVSKPKKVSKLQENTNLIIPDETSS